MCDIPGLVRVLSFGTVEAGYICGDYGVKLVSEHPVAPHRAQRVVAASGSSLMARNNVYSAGFRPSGGFNCQTRLSVYLPRIPAREGDKTNKIAG